MQPSQLSRVAVIACTKVKRSEPARAIDLYDRSPLFRLSVDAARKDGLRILVLSSKYGLVDSDALLRPYEVDLPKMSPADRASWQQTLNHQARELLADQGVREAVALAGAAYRQALRAACTPLGIRVSTHPEWRTICDGAFERDVPSF